MTAISEELREKARAKLKAYNNERTLETEILIPLYKSMGFCFIERVHGQVEHRHKSDILMAKNGAIGFFGVQVKCSHDKNCIDNNTALVISIYQDARTALTYYVDEIKKSMTHYFWVTMGEISPTIGRKHINVECTSDIMGKVTFMDVDDIIEDIIKYKPELISGLEIIPLLEKLNGFSEKGDKAFAAHFAFKIFIDRLLEGELSRAKEYMEQAISLLEEQENCQIFYIRSLKKFYKLWKKILEYNNLKIIIDDLHVKKGEVGEYERTWAESVFLLRIVNNSSIKKYLEPNGNAELTNDYLCDYNFLCDFQYVFSQLQILFYEYADSPAGLSSKQICRTLLRFGFPPIGKLAARITKMKEELLFENNCSVDSECSLCTGTVLSCLFLANEDNEIIEKISIWLQALDYCKYSHRKREINSSDADNTEHALHYAAEVLNAFIDCDEKKTTNSILECFFNNDSIGKDGFYLEWMMHRNISNTETCAYILSAFLRLLLSLKHKYPFDKIQQNLIKTAVTNLVKVLYNETTPQSKPWRLYATRENIQSLCLGLLVGEKDATIDLLKELMQNIHYRAIIIKKEPQKKVLLDSNVDRTTRFIEGWVSYWETISYLLNDAPEFDANGVKLRRTIKELKDESYLPNYNKY